MHAIERYGLVALVLLVVSSAAVVVWDEEAANAAAVPEDEQLAAVTTGEQAGQRSALARNETGRSETGRSDTGRSDTGRSDAARSDAGPGARRSAPAQPSASAPRSSAQRPSSPQLNTTRLSSEQGRRQRDRSLPSVNNPAREVQTPSRGLQAEPRQSQGAERQNSESLPTTLQRPVESLVQPAAVQASGEQETERAQLATAGTNRGSRGRTAGGRQYKVKDGESLWRIAARELGDGERWSEIVALNQLPNPDVVKPGDVLRLPGPASVASGSSSARARQLETTPSPRAAGREHRVRAGQSLWRIAAAELGDGERWTEIAELNGLDDPNAIREGDVLRLPAQQSSQRTLLAQAVSEGTSSRRVR